MEFEYDGEIFEVWLIDDGTLDTVIEVNDIEHRFSDTSYWRDKNGELSKKGLIELAKEVIESDERYWELAS
ncbi:MAG: hypothetical protein CMB80_24600 [Flammeovirgaceae bacterium]|nr:hypothetical protein [Flammeovirgaceae bacterium]